MSVQVKVRHNLRLLTKSVEEIKPKVLEAMNSTIETTTNYMVGQLQRSAPAEGKEMAEGLKYDVKQIDENTVRGVVYSDKHPYVAFVTLEFGGGGAVIELRELVPIFKKEGEQPVKPLDQMSRKEREDWERYRIVWVWSKRIVREDRGGKPWLIPTFRATFPEIVERLKNSIAFRFEEIRKKNQGEKLK